jgi:Right handed beta helix region
MNRTKRTGRRLGGLFLVPLAALAVLVVILSGGLVSGAGATPQSSLPTPQLTISGSWTITTAVSYADISISVGGSITIESGGSLTLQDVTLGLLEANPLSFGITVDDGGGLYATGSTFESLTPANHLWMRANAGAHLTLTGGSVLDLGGPSGPYGFQVDAADSTFNGVTFNSYYEALLVSAEDVTVENCSFQTTTSTSSSTWVVSTSDTSSGFVMTDSTIVDTSMAGGALFVTSSSDIENSTFTLDPQGTNPTPILIGYSGSDGFANASGTRFVYNTVSGSDVVDFDSSDVTISHNVIRDTGGTQYVHDYGVRAEVFNPSGKGIWVNGLSVEYNYISDATSYGVRVEQNITNSVIAHNTITNISSDPQAGVYNGAQTYVGIYLIRGVSHVLVEDNYIDNSADQESHSINTAGVGLESDVDYCTVANNTVINTDLGIWVQGDWNDGPGNIGPSLHNVVTGNTFRNTLPVVQTDDLASAIQNYDWANYTTISDNLIEGWNKVPGGVSSYEGEAIHQADDYGTIAGNVVNGATSGVVFGYFYGAGVSNASDNVVYGNLLNVTGAAVAVDTASTPGPIQNVVDLVTAKSTSSGFPTTSLQTIRAANGVGFAESDGNFSATLQTENPITGMVANFTSAIPWSSPDFSVHISGDLGSGTVSASMASVTSTEAKYSVTSASGTLYHAVALDVPSEYYSAAYTVSEAARSSTQTFSVNSSAGPALFESNGTGSVSVAVGLDSWTPTNPPSTVDLELNVTTSGGVPVPDLSVQVGLDEPSGLTSITLGPSNTTGGAIFLGLPAGTTVVNVTLLGSDYTLTDYSVLTPQSSLLLLEVVVAPAPVRNATTYAVEFTERGLGNNTAWWVSVTGPEAVNLTTSGTTITFNLVNGTYQYSVGSPAGEYASVPTGTLVFPGSVSAVVVNFTTSQPSGSGSPPPGSSSPPLPHIASPLSWVPAAAYLFVAAFVAALVIGTYALSGGKRGGGSSRRRR